MDQLFQNNRQHLLANIGRNNSAIKSKCFQNTVLSLFLIHFYQSNYQFLPIKKTCKNTTVFRSGNLLSRFSHFFSLFSYHFSIFFLVEEKYKTSSLFPIYNNQMKKQLFSVFFLLALNCHCASLVYYNMCVAQGNSPNYCSSSGPNDPKNYNFGLNNPIPDDFSGFIPPKSLPCPPRSHRVSNPIGLIGLNCECQKGYHMVNNQCQINDCGMIPNLIGQMPVYNQCNCPPGSKWQGYRCQPEMKYATGLIPPKMYEGGAQLFGRKCQPGYRPEGQSSCVKDTNFNLNCNGIANSRGQQNFMTCNCLQGYIWTDRLCQRDCARVANSNGQRSSPQSCQCNSGFTWRDNGCQSDRVSCWAVPNSNGREAWPNGCECNAGYKWEGKSCVEDRVNFAVNCNSIANSRGQQNFMTCNCLQGYIWTDRLCQRDCARVANSNGQRSSPQSCQCNSGFTWRDNGCQSDRVASIRPIIDCWKIPNADGPAEPNCCKCKKGYRWERNSCMKDNTPVRPPCSDHRKKCRH